MRARTKIRLSFRLCGRICLTVSIAAITSLCIAEREVQAALRKQGDLVIYTSNTPAYNDGTIVLSPLSKQTIWKLIAGGYAFELVPETGEWKKLDYLLGGINSGASRNMCGIPDPYSPGDLWFGNFHDGVLRLNLPTGGKAAFTSRQHFKGQAITAIVPDRKAIWIGASGGLFSIRRADGEVTAITAFSGMWIRSLSVRDNILTVNGAFYDSASMTPVAVSAPPPVPHASVMGPDGEPSSYVVEFSTASEGMAEIRDVNGRWIAAVRDIPTGPIFVDDKDHLWFVGEGFSILEYDLLAKKEVFRSSSSIGAPIEESAADNQSIYLLVSAQLHVFDKHARVWATQSDFYYKDILVNNEYLWIVRSDGSSDGRMQIVRVPKQHVGQIFKDSPKAVEYKKRTEALLSAWGGGAGLVELIPLVSAWLKNDYEDEPMQSKPLIEMNLRGALCTRDVAEISAVRKIAETADPAQREVAYYVLARCPILVGDALTSCAYLNRFESEFPSSRLNGLLMDDDRVKLKNACRDIRQLRQARKSKDEELWLLGKIYFDALSLPWNEVEVGFNMDYPNSLHADLIRGYPQSKWAAAATFFDLEHFESDIHEGGSDSMECVPKYEEFIRRYPTSEFVPAARLQIAQHYYSPPHDGESAAEADYRRNAMAQYRRIIADYPRSKEAQSAREKLRETGVSK